MKQIIKVRVKKFTMTYECKFSPPGKWKCGACLYGVVRPMMGKRCAVCDAKVVEVLAS